MIWGDRKTSVRFSLAGCLVLIFLNVHVFGVNTLEQIKFLFCQIMPWGRTDFPYKIWYSSSSTQLSRISADPVSSLMLFRKIR